MKGASRLDQYPEVIPYSIRSYGDSYPQRSLIYAEGKKNIGLKGEGTIDGDGLSLDFLLNNSKKPFGIRFISCRNVLYEGITLKNSGFWMMHNLNCDSMTIRNVTIINHAYGNNDGINIDGCRNVLVENCNVDSNNDPIVIKTMSVDASAENIIVRNCTFATYSRAIKVGTETYAPVRNVHVHDCIVKYSNKGPAGSSFPGKCGILLTIADGGSLDNVVVENIDIKGVSTPIFIRLGDRANTYSDTIAALPPGTLRNVRLENINAEAATSVTSSVSGIPGHYIENITLKNINISMQGGGKAVEEGFVVPENISGKPEHDMFGEILPSYGLFVRHVKNLTLDNVCVTTKSKDARPELYFEDTAQITQIACGSSVPTGIFEKDVYQLKVYPNPSRGNFIIEIPVDFMMPDIECTDIKGRRVFRQSVYQGLQEFTLENESPGMYFLYVKDITGKTGQIRLVKN